MNSKRELIPNIFLGIALVGLLVFAGAWLLRGGHTSIGGNIALALAVVAIALYIFLRPEEIKGAVTSRQARYGGNTALMTIIFITILVLINFLSMKQFKRWDLTAEKRFSLAPETIEVLKNLQTPVTALNFTIGGSGSQSDAKILLDQYRAYSDKFQVQAIDPDAQPTLARQYLASNGMVVLVAGDQHVTVSNPTEADITAALIKVTRPTQAVVYVTTGHGEHELEDGGDFGYAVVKAALERDGFQVKPLALVTTNTIPSDAGVVIIGGPHTPLQPRETETLRTYLARGGRLMVMLDTSLATMMGSSTAKDTLGDAGLGSLLNDWGITLRDDWVLDPVSSQVTDPGTNIAFKYGNSPIVSKLQNQATAFPNARSIELTTTAPANITLTPLVYTSDQSWGVSDLESAAQSLRTGLLPNPGAKDAKGSLILAASAANSQTGARLAVFGSSIFVANAESRQFGTNFDLFLNGVNWLAEQESQITIRPKPFEARPLTPTVGLMAQVALVSICLMPLAVLVVGAIVWWRRR